MRLLNVETIELREFFESDIPPYAILSHCWEDGEVSFKDVTKKRNLDAPGWNKIRECCEFVRQQGELDWVWVDTCCIDKRSSAELSEAINSMYHWYYNATVCYAYLYDVGCEGKDVVSLHRPRKDAAEETIRKDLIRAFRQSKWFTRCWTLQEFLAPKWVSFIDRDWKGTLGSRNLLQDLLHEITGIGTIYMQGTYHNRYESIARRMSWASKRQCTRSEDIAYSLLGIFNVNMPLLYGEGKEAAFRRLQLEILKDSDDESIFAWETESSRDTSNHGLLATSPANFPSTSIIVPLKGWNRPSPYSMTNRGLALTTVCTSIDSSGMEIPEGEFIVIPLRCKKITENPGREQPLAILVCWHQQSERYARWYVGPWWKPQPCLTSLIDQEGRKFVGEEKLLYLMA